MALLVTLTELRRIFFNWIHTFTASKFSINKIILQFDNTELVLQIVKSEQKWDILVFLIWKFITFKILVYLILRLADFLHRDEDGTWRNLSRFKSFYFSSEGFTVCCKTGINFLNLGSLTIKLSVPSRSDFKLLSLIGL